MTAKCALKILFWLVLAACLPGAELLADDIRFFGDWSYLNSLIESTDREDGEVTKTETERYKQNYRLDISKQLFPNLTVDGGAQVEISRQLGEIDDDESNSRNTSIQPYVDAELATSLYSLSAEYRERSEKDYQRSVIDTITTSGTTRRYVDSYSLRGEWRPVDLPRFDLSYQNTESYDKPFERRKETDILQFNSRYSYDNYEFRYGFFRTEDQITDADDDRTGAVSNTHNGRVRYSRSYLDGRVTMNASLRGEYSEQTFSGSSLRDFSVFPSGSGFYVENAELNPNDIVSDAFPPLVDNPPDLAGGDVINIGLDFGEAVEVDMLQLSLSGELDTNSHIDDLANWTVYVSDDRVSWVSRPVDTVEYFAEEDRLDIRFSPAAQHDYILLVYNPPLALDQSQPVPVSAVRAYVSRFLEDGSQLSTHAVNGQFGLGWQVSDKTKVLYDLGLQERRSSLFDDQRIRMNNGLTVLHLINEIFSATGRVSVSDTWEQSKHDASRYSYSAKLNARYLETLRQALIYSGGLNQEQEGTSTTNSLLLHTSAELYRGWDVSFDQGYSWESPAEGADSSSFFVRIENSLVPHRRLSLVADYSITWEKETGEEVVRSDSGRLRGSWVPSDTLSLTGEIQLRVKDGDADLFWEYGVSWLPLRDGTLQCHLNYSEEEDADGNLTRSFSPDISWDMTHYANLSVRYSQGKDESNSKVDEFRTVLATLKIYYD